MNSGTGTNERSMAARRKGRNGSERIRQRVEHARDLASDLRERAELTFREKPYLLPVAAGAVGLGVGVLLGSKLTRFVFFTAVGTFLSETFGSEIRRIGRDFVEDLRDRLEEDEGELAEGE